MTQQNTQISHEDMERRDLSEWMMDVVRVRMRKWILEEVGYRDTPASKNWQGCQLTGNMKPKQTVWKLKLNDY